MKGRRVFITGGAGFIGSRLAERLAPDNTITIFDNLSRDALSHRVLGDSVEVVKGDVLDTEQLAASMAGHDVVVHCAAIAGIDNVSQSPVTTMRVNSLGSHNVLDAAHTVGGMSRVLCFSTSEVFGPRAIDVTESDDSHIGPPGEPRWTYAVSKLAEEHLALAFYTQYGLPTVVVRPFNVYGPGQVGEGAIERFCRAAIAGDPLVVRGDGNQVRAWTYVDDMLDGVLAALSKPEAIGHAFNLGNPRSTITVLHLARLVVELAASPSTVEFAPGGADIRVRVPDVTKASRVLGFRPQVELPDGIAQTLSWMRGAT